MITETAAPAASTTEPTAAEPSAALVDPFGRSIRYLRISVTDRCDFRCVYCMSEDMTFVPRQQLLSLEEIVRIAGVFVAAGVTKIRLTGGEPLVRRGLVELSSALAKLPGLQELCLSTNGARLEAFAQPLVDAGVKRVNISLDSLRPERFRQLTRTGDVTQVLRGIEAASAAGFAGIKLNAVILKGRNDDEVVDLVDYAQARGLDICFIEEMPLGIIQDHDRAEVFCSSEDIKQWLAPHYQLTPLPDSASQNNAGGPSRYYQARSLSAAAQPRSRAGRIGFISPHSRNFCGDCNRVRLTAEGRLLLCLGNEHSADLRALVRSSSDDQVLAQGIREAIQRKPYQHNFDLAAAPQILRFMNATGG